MRNLNSETNTPVSSSLYPYTKNAYGHSGRDGTYTTQNVIIETEQFGRVYYIASTPTDAGSYGLDAITQAVLAELGTR